LGQGNPSNNIQNKQAHQKELIFEDFHSLDIRWSLFVGGLAYTTFVAANIYPAWYILIPSSVVVGIGAAVLWNAQGVCIFSCVH
jgi:hypothetical protein